MEWSGVNSLAETARTFCKHQRLQAISNGEIHRRPATAESKTPAAMQLNRANISRAGNVWGLAMYGWIAMFAS